MIKILVIAVLVIVVTSLTTTSAYAKFIHEDFEITNFGLKDGNPYIDVVGQAGQSFPEDCDDSCYYAYLFETDKGMYAILAGSNLEDPPKASYGVEHFKATSIKEGEEYDIDDVSANHRFSEHTAEFIPRDLEINQVSKVYTMYLDAGDPTTIGKIWSSK